MILSSLANPAPKTVILDTSWSRQQRPKAVPETLAADPEAGVVLTSWVLASVFLHH